MKTSTRLSTLALSLPGLAQAYVHLPFSRLVGRASNPSLSLWGDDYVYVVNATVGTPGQSVALVLSPSTGDTWVPDASSGYCNYTQEHEYYDETYGYQYNYTYSTFCLWGSYDKGKSSTYQRANSAYRDFSGYTPDANYISGDNCTDTLKIGDVTVDNLPIALAQYSDQWIGSLGLGSNYSYSSSSLYDNFPDRLLKAGTIATKAYSIWLDAEDGSAGSLLMGAVDTSKYDGTLTRVDASSTGGYYTSFGLYVNSVNSSTEAYISNELPFMATVGPGETFSNVPDSIAKKMWTAAGATYNSTIYMATIPCDAASKSNNNKTRFTLELAGAGGPVLEVHLADLVLPQTVAATRWGRDSYSSYSLSSAPPNTCFFAVQNGSMWYTTYGGYSDSSSSSSEHYNVGAPLLRRSYMVFDLVNQELAIAPVKFGSTAASKVVAFEKYGAPAPSATTFCQSKYSCTSRGSGGSGSDDPTSGSGSGSGSGLPDPSHINVGLVAGLSVAFGLITLLALVGAFLAWRKVLKRKQEPEGDALLETNSATDRAPVVQQPPLARLPPVREEMAEVAPQLGVTPPVEEERGASPPWPLQHGSSAEETPSVTPDVHQEPTPPVGNGKGKEVVGREDH